MPSGARADRMSWWLLSTLGAAALGSVFPLVNIELYLVGVVTAVPEVSWWALALAATVGQVAGKTLFYLAGRGSFTLGSRLGRTVRTERGSRWSAWVHRFHRRCEQRPLWGLATLLLGAITGIPPYTVMSFVSGAAGIGWTGFLVTSLAGRSVHFLLVAGAPELVRQLPVPFG